MKSFKVPGTEMILRFHELSGLGVPLVFIHGLGCAASCDFPRVATDASLRPRRSFLLDLAGSGFSDKPQDFSYSLQDHSLCVIALLESLGVPQVNLIMNDPATPLQTRPLPYLSPIPLSGEARLDPFKPQQVRDVE